MPSTPDATPSHPRPAHPAPEVRTERIGTSLVITLDRPRARNAVNAAVAAQLAAALDELAGDPELRAGVLTGAGGTFSAGMDLKAALAGESPEIPGRGFGGLTETVTTKPLIAAVEGWAMGGGFELALACDLIVAAQRTVTAALAASADVREGMTAFAERRAPVWQGK